MGSSAVVPRDCSLSRWPDSPTYRSISPISRFCALAEPTLEDSLAQVELLGLLEVDLVEHDVRCVLILGGGLRVGRADGSTRAAPRREEFYHRQALKVVNSGPEVGLVELLHLEAHTSSAGGAGGSRSATCGHCVAWIGSANNAITKAGTRSRAMINDGKPSRARRS
eukprot:5085783-Prymnesium_polylepis.1